MKRSIMLPISAALVLFSTAALAIKSGDAIYVRARGTKLFKDAAGAQASSGTLQPGEKLVWVEQSKENPRYHKVKTAKGQTAWVYFQDVSATPPKQELVVEGDKSKNIDAQAFASYGAAARGLTAETKTAAAKSKDPVKLEKVAGQLEQVEKIAGADRKGGR